MERFSEFAEAINWLCNTSVGDPRSGYCKSYRSLVTKPPLVIAWHTFIARLARPFFER
jgi:hypothetical protein